MRKRNFFINTYPEKAKEVMRRMTFTPNVGAGQLFFQKRSGYNVIQNKAIVDKGKIIIGSTSVAVEERPDEPSPKRQKIMKEQGPHIK